MALPLWAQRTYGVSEVNNMPQGMERHHGIFICTTNSLGSLHAAAQGRFTFKILFLPLTAAQREQMFTTQALAGDARELTFARGQRLGSLTQLCPGDFAAVKRQTKIVDTRLTSDEFLAQLEAEHRLKPGVQRARSIGFVG